MNSKSVAFLVAFLFALGLIGGGVYIAAGDPAAATVKQAKENGPGACC
ncbi:hypothetical protein ACFV0T_27925 [Streptomyces sp. NPDC059582]